MTIPLKLKGLLNWLEMLYSRNLDISANTTEEYETIYNSLYEIVLEIQQKAQLNRNFTVGHFQVYSHRIKNIIQEYYQ
jgi:hypothetical protein